MKKYGVSVPIAGYVYIEVEAENEQDAMDKAFEKGYTWDDVVETDMYEQIVEGNVCHLSFNEISVEEIDDEE